VLVRLPFVQSWMEAQMERQQDKKQINSFSNLTSNVFIFLHYQDDVFDVRWKNA
jgi:aminoglycoside phosphotransferase (APT) family kinase protein